MPALSSRTSKVDQVDRRIGQDQEQAIDSKMAGAEGDTDAHDKLGLVVCRDIDSCVRRSAKARISVTFSQILRLDLTVGA